MKLILLIVLACSFYSPLQHTAPKHVPNPKAVALERKAIKLYIASHNLDSAITLLKGAISIDPSYGSAYCELATMYWGQKAYSKALAPLKRYTELEPDNPEGLAGYGIILEMRKKTKEAYSYYQKAADLNREKLKHTNVWDKQYLALQVNYAFDLKLLNKEAECNKIIESALADHPDYLAALWLKKSSRAQMLSTMP